MINYITFYKRHIKLCYTNIITMVTNLSILKFINIAKTITINLNYY